MGVQKKTQTMNFRVDRETQDIWLRAAKASGKSVTAFVTEAATHAAQRELLDQRFIGVGSDVFDSVLAQLDAPADINAKLVDLLKRERDWID